MTRMATTPAATSTKPCTAYMYGSSDGRGASGGEGEGEDEGEGEGDGRAVEVGKVGLEDGQLAAQCM